MAHDVAQRQAPDLGPVHDGGHVRRESARDAELAREEEAESFRLPVAVAPAAGWREGDDGARPTALGQFKGECASRRIADDVYGVHAKLVKLGLEHVGAGRERGRAADRIGRAAVVAGEGRSDHLVASDKLAEHGTPVMPGTQEAVQQQQRLAVAGTVEGGRDLSHWA